MKPINRLIFAFLTCFIVVSLFASIFTTKVNADISTGLVGYWRLDETSGTSALDSSGNGHSGTVTPPANWTIGKYENALNLDGTSSRITVSTAIDFSLGFTVAFWIKGYNLSKTEYLYINYGGSKYAYLRAMANTCKLLGRINNGSTSQDVSGTTVVLDGSWHFVVWIVNLTSGYDRTFVDNVADSNLGNLGSTFYPNGNDNYFGGYLSFDNYLFSGLIDEIRLYNVGISAQIATELYSGFTVISSSDLGIDISPLGNTTVGASQSQTYTISPKTGYSLNTLFIDSILQGIASGSYTFPNIVSNHTIYVTSFLLPQNVPPFPISPTFILLIILIIVCLILSVFRIPLIGFVFSVFTIAFAGYSTTDSTLPIYLNIFVAVIGAICLLLNIEKFQSSGNRKIKKGSKL